MVIFVATCTEFLSISDSSIGAVNSGYSISCAISKRTAPKEAAELAGYLPEQSLQGLIMGPLPTQLDGQQLTRQFTHTMVP